ncbi:hypothetical protein GCM10023322_20920 [Rugosimonospora acidiphila]|uniref:DUF1003 domain-containing protein n=1 Tax=Rugosimonospora acidiphila TaxID=556531 RepID=A0ABP9RQ75_9ACTN
MTTTDDSNRVHGWHRHPGVRSDGQLTLGERAADHMRNSMGSWLFVFAALLFLAAWMGFNRNAGFDKYPFILLNLVLSCLAALQGAILLIAAKRSDQIASELAQHDYETDSKAERLVERLADRLDQMTAEQQELRRQVAELTDALRAGAQLGDAPA